MLLIVREKHPKMKGMKVLFEKNTEENKTAVSVSTLRIGEFMGVNSLIWKDNRWQWLVSYGFILPLGLHRFFKPARGSFFPVTS